MEKRKTKMVLGYIVKHVIKKIIEKPTLEIKSIKNNE
jgi:hypothetical protein